MRVFYNIKSSIMKKLILSYFAIIMIPVIIGGLYVNFYIQASIKKDFLWLIESQLQQMKQNISEKIDSCKQSTNSILRDKYLINILQIEAHTDLDIVDILINNTIPRLESIQAQNGNIYKVKVLHGNRNLQNAAGLVIYDPGIEDGTWEKKLQSIKLGNLQLYEDMYIESIHTEKFNSSSNLEGKSKIVSIYRPIYGYLDKMVGIMEIDILGDTILDSLINNENKEFEMNTLVTNEASILYSSRADFKGLTKQDLHRPENFFSFTSDNKYYIAKTEVEEINNWIVLYIPESLLHLKDNYRMILIAIILVGIITLYIMIYFLIKIILGKLTKLTDAMNKVKQGDLDTVCIISGSDEVDHLSESFNEMINKIKDLLNNLKESNIAEKEALYEALVNQMNPHFICNALDMIRITSEMNNQPNISNMIVKIMNLFVYNVTIKQRYVTLKDELKNATGYIDIHNLISKSKVDIHINVCSELSGILDQYLVIKFILQPLVENCVKHAFGKKNEHDFIFMDIRREGDYIFIMIEDNGLGITEIRMKKLREYLDLNKDDYQLETKGNGIGLRNISERLYMNYGIINAVEVESSCGIGSCVTLKIPVMKK